MEFQVMKNNQGIRNLYFGHPFSRETYTNSVMLRTPVSSWSIDLDGVYSGKKISLDQVISFNSESVEEEFRVIRGTKCMFIGDYEKIQEMESDIQVYHDLCNKALIRTANPDYMDFETFTEKVLGDPLKSIEEMTSISIDEAKKYMDAAVKYDADKLHSDKLIIKPYFTTFDEGCLILTDDFVDFNLNLKVDPENGVVGAIIWLSENTSKYTKHYKNI